MRPLCLPVKHIRAHTPGRVLCGMDWLILLCSVKAHQFFPSNYRGSDERQRGGSSFLLPGAWSGSVRRIHQIYRTETAAWCSAGEPKQWAKRRPQDGWAGLFAFSSPVEVSDCRKIEWLIKAIEVFVPHLNNLQHIFEIKADKARTSFFDSSYDGCGIIPLPTQTFSDWWKGCILCSW